MVTAAKVTKKDIKLQDYGSFFLKTMRICVPLHPKKYISTKKTDETLFSHIPHSDIFLC